MWETPLSHHQRRIALALLIGSGVMSLILPEAAGAGGSGWSSPATIAEAGMYPETSVGPSGQALVGWADLEQVWAASAAPGSSLGEPAGVARIAAGTAVLQLASAIAPGEATVAWILGEPQPNTHRFRLTIRYAVRGRAASGYGDARPIRNVLDLPTDLTLDAGGATAAVAAWRGHDGGRAIFLQVALRPAGSGFGNAMTLTARGQAPSAPRLAVDGLGNVTVVYAALVDAVRRVFSVTCPPGGSCAAPTALSDGTDSARDPQVAISAAGTTLVSWTAGNANGPAIRWALRPPGGSFGPQQVLPAFDKQASGSRATFAPDGSAYVAFVASRPDGIADDGVVVARRPPEGAFGAPEPLPGGPQRLLALDVTSDGSLVALATRWRDDGGSDTQASELTPGVGFSPARALTAASVTQLDVAAGGPRLVAVWSELPGDAGTAPQDAGTALPTIRAAVFDSEAATPPLFADTTAPSVRVRARPRQRAGDGRVSVLVRCSERCTARVTIRRPHGTPARLAPAVGRTLRAGRWQRVVLRLRHPPRSRREASILISARDLAGNTGRARTRIRIG